MNPSYNKPIESGRTSGIIVNEINPVRALVHGSSFGLVVLGLLHPLIALAMRSSSLVATAHAFLTVIIGVCFALFSKDMRKAGYIAAYITGAEVLWRMTGAQVFWEGGKYFTILILGLAFLRTKPKLVSLLPIILYFLLLSLSIPLTIEKLGFSNAARDFISFNLSGPFALMVCIIYFSQITLNQDNLWRMLWCGILPVLGMATLILSGMLSAERIIFTNDSNYATSGGFGPNQVSAILGLGGGLAILLFLMGKRFASRWLTIFLALGLLSLSALTFSRGGMYNAAAMGLLTLVHFLRNARGRTVAILAMLVISIAGGYLIFPRLNAFTGGMLGARFSDFDTTSRTKIAQADLGLWLDNPVLGVGPGMSARERLSFIGIAPHTEYTRILAEHGLAGLLALLVLLWMAVRAYSRAPALGYQTWVAALLAWPFLEMSHAAMRIVAISFLFGLAMVKWETSPEFPKSLKAEP